MQGRRAALCELTLDLGTHLLGHGRAQVQVSESRAQVQAGAADDDRAPAIRQQPVDLGVGVLRVAPGAELLARIDEGEEPVLEPLLLRRVRRRAQHLETAINLDRVAVDRDGVLPALPQALGQRDRHPRFADGRRAEESEDPQAARLSSRSDPLSVVEVAAVMSTSTNSPGAAVPSKLTVLLCRVRPRSRVGSVRLGPSTRTSILRPTKRSPRSRARRWTNSTRRSMRSRLTAC